jgi:transglutaminase-like putative cysteine protease
VTEPARARPERALLALALGAASGAYLLAYVAPAGWPAALPILALAFLVTAPSVFVEWTRVPARLVRSIRLALPVVLVATALPAIFSRHVPILGQDTALRWGMLAGGLLAVLAALLLYGGRHWRVAVGLLPATLGILAAAGLDPRARGFVALAVLAGAALWTHAILTGGPRRRGLALGLFAVGGAGLAWGTIRLLPWAQPHVTSIVARAYSEARTGLSDQSELGDVQRLAPSRRVVARVWTERPQLLRMQVFDHFDGRRWSASVSPQTSLEPAASGTSAPGPLLESVPGQTFVLAPPPPDGGSMVETRIVTSMTFDDGWGLLLPAGPASLRLPGESVKVDRLGRVFVRGGLPLVYGAAGLPGSGLGRSGPTDADRQVPKDADDGVRRLASELSAGSASDGEALARTIALFHARPYRYTLDVGAFATKDPVAEFLLRKKAGYCEYFATAAVLLLRLQGVPARYVRGVVVPAERRVAGHYVVRESDAHAWVEAYLDGRGWVEADPTPPADYAALHATPPAGRLEESWEAVRAAAARAWAWLREAFAPGVIAWLGRAAQETWAALRQRPALAATVVVATALGVFAARRRASITRWWASRRRRSAIDAASAERVPAELRALLGRVERHWDRRGHRRPPARGLREHLDALPPDALSPAARAASARIVDSYYRASFGGRAPSSEEMKHLAADLATLS